jgi:hypothetical protein
MTAFTFTRTVVVGVKASNSWVAGGAFSSLALRGLFWALGGWRAKATSKP